jgi:UDP-GlcNAc3NAcA epimerase
VGCQNLISFVVGTRPQVIKLASLCKAFDQIGLEYEIVHTGQHYDFEMDKVFFDELKLPSPSVNLGVGSGTHAKQTAEVMVRLEKYFTRNIPKLAVVPGDTNSALGAALVVSKMAIIIAHVEAGLRSFQQSMPEEINRVIIDHISNLLFAPTKTASKNLAMEGLKSKTYLTGDVMADNVMLMKNRLSNVEVEPQIESKRYVYVTLHRSENVDDSSRLGVLLHAIASVPQKFGLDVVFPVHPRTKARIDSGAISKYLDDVRIHVIKPVGYVESLKLARDAAIVITDSGGLQKEAFLLGTPVVTVREKTEWVETVEVGWNRLVGDDVKALNDAIMCFIQRSPPHVNPFEFYGGGRAAKRIARIISKTV